MSRLCNLIRKATYYVMSGEDKPLEYVNILSFIIYDKWEKIRFNKADDYVIRN